MMEHEVREHEVKDLSLAPAGRLRIEWAEAQMPVLGLTRSRMEKELPFEGVKIAACLHVTSETANLARTLKAGGAQVALCASNPLSTQDEVAASLVADYEIAVFAVRGVDSTTYYKHIDAALELGSDLTVDDGADLVSVLHSKSPEKCALVRGGSEETTTGVIRLRAMAAAGELRYPIVAVNDALTKHLFDNRYGTGQSALDGVIRATNVLIAGRVVVIGGYGMCGRGVASRARGHGADVVVCEVDPLRALEAVMDGYRVMPSVEAARVGDIFITVTGNRDVLGPEQFSQLKDGAILANAGHFDVEIDVAALTSTARSVRVVRPEVEEYLMDDGRRIYLLSQGRLVNLAAAEGHPASVMDMSFANQALVLEWIIRADALTPQVYSVPAEIDMEVARLKLAAMGVEIDRLTGRQRSYLESWQEGT